jgi:hypothetical protein
MPAEARTSVCAAFRTLEIPEKNECTATYGHVNRIVEVSGASSLGAGGRRLDVAQEEGGQDE